MEALNHMITAVVSGGLLEGFRVGNASFSHILFADDTLIFCDARSSQLRYLRSLFLLFEAVSGLKVNLAKIQSNSSGECRSSGKVSRHFRV
jgi:hypothetical protein